MKIITKPKSGLFEEPIETYHASGAIGSTALRLFMESPRKFEHYLENGTNKSTAYDIGSALHCLVLEPDNFDDRFISEPPVNKRTKTGREELEAFKSKHEGKIFLSPDEITLVIAMAESIGTNYRCCDLLSETDRELSARVGLSNDLIVQCRPDAIKDRHIIDLKTCQSVNRFRYDISSHGYHLQAAFYYFILSSLYPERWGCSDFYFLAVEKSPPFDIGIFGLDNPVMVKLVEENIKPALYKLKNYLDNESKDTRETLQEVEWLNIF